MILLEAALSAANTGAVDRYDFIIEYLAGLILSLCRSIRRLCHHHVVSHQVIRAGSLFVAGCSILTAGAQAQVEIARLDHAPELDGSLNDSAWRRATRFTDFKTLHPQPGKEPTQRTEVYLAYDNAKLYVGVRSLDREPGSIRALARLPSEAWSDDWVAFCLDPRDDGLEALYFLVTPAGLKLSGALGYDGGPVQMQALRWSGFVKRSNDGFTAEMAIPLAQLPYASGDRVHMAFKVARAISRSREEMDFPEIDPSRPHLAQFKRIVLSGIERSQAPYDRPLFDVQAAYHEKVRQLKVSGADTLAGRVEAWGDASVLDYLIFPSRPLARSNKPFSFRRRPQEGTVASRFEGLEYAPSRPIGRFNEFLERIQTTSFIVIHDDTVVYEKYFNGWKHDSIFTSFSVAKAFVSTLAGIAIDRGMIHSVEDKITLYLPELERRDARFSRITIKDLLRMSSGLRYLETEPFYDNRRTYLDPDLRRAGLEGSTIEEDPGKHWLYNNYNPLLLGMILERVSGRSVTDLLQAWLWNPLGMEYGGSWSLDSREHGFEKMESGLNIRPIDLAKLGRLFLNHGKWNGTRIVSEGWIHEATQPWQESEGYFKDHDFFGRGAHYFGYFWWGDRRQSGECDFHTVGNKGQYIYCSPQKHLIIVRTGIQFGINSTDWLRLFRQFADQF